MGRNRRRNCERRNMVEESAMLIMRSDQQRTVPFSTIPSQQIIYIAKKVFPGTDRCWWMVVVGSPAEMDRRITVFGFDEDHTGHFRSGFRLEICRKMPET